MNIGIIGGGSIATFLLNKINKENMPDLHITSIFVRDKKKCAQLRDDYDVVLFDDLNKFLHSNIDIVVEAANIEAVHTLIPSILKEKDLVMISIGALADEEFLKEVYERATIYNRSIYLPSGAIGGLDLLQSAQALGEITDVTLTTRKAAASLLDEEVHEETVVFDGVAKDAIAKFPKNINVSIVLSLAGIGVNHTKVKIIADPFIHNNMHTVLIKGAFGSATYTIENNPMVENPNSSYLAALSILSTLKKLSNRIKIGF